MEKSIRKQEVLPIKRRMCRQIHIGSVGIGGNSPISVQTMTKTDTRDVSATIEQILELEQLGCDIVRIAVIDPEAANAILKIKRAVHIPLIADIHFDYKLALLSLKAGIDGLRINPGNIGSVQKVKEIIQSAKSRNVPIRIGVNAGSLEKDILSKYGAPTTEALVESATRHMQILEDLDYREMKLSVKASDVTRTVCSYRQLAEICDYPLHLGVTEAGTLIAGTVLSSVALGILLSEGIGDTIRVSLTEHPRREVQVGQDILRCLGLRKQGPRIISCPTCGRVQIDVVNLAHQMVDEMEKLAREYPDRHLPSVAVMGCMVNGPGEAREADIAVAGGKGKAAIYVNGKIAKTVQQKDALPALLQEVRRFIKNEN